jgi:hypothetical protein
MADSVKKSDRRNWKMAAIIAIKPVQWQRLVKFCKNTCAAGTIRSSTGQRRADRYPVLRAHNNKNLLATKEPLWIPNKP